MTWYSVVWCTGEWDVTPNISIPCHFEKVTDKQMLMYAIYYNFSLADNSFMKAMQQPAPIDKNMLRIKMSVDNSIMRHLAKEKNLDTIPRIDA